MIAFASAIVDPEAYRRFAGPGIARVAEPDSEILAYAAVGTVCRGYNLLLEAAARLSGLEALVLVDPRLELTDAALCATIRTVLADPAVAVVGWAGAAGSRTIAWWDGELRCAPVEVRHDEHGGGRLPAWPWAQRIADPVVVDAVDASLLVLSPWAVATLRFDESLVQAIGHEVDLCSRVRAAGRTVVVAPVRAVHHRALDVVADPELWVQGHRRMADKWDESLHGELTQEQWRRRARRAEAERDAARTLAYSNALQADAHVLELEHELAELTSSRSWRATAPLRAAAQAVRRWRGR